MKKMLKRRSGFTLVELLIVIIIIGILAGAMLLVAGSGGDSAEATKIISDLRSLKSAALLYYADHPINPQMPDTTDLQKYMDRVLGASYDITGTNGTSPYFDNWWISSTTNEIASSTIEMAAAPVRSSFSISVRIHCEDTSVSPGTAPPMSRHTRSPVGGR